MELVQRYLFVLSIGASIAGVLRLALHQAGHSKQVDMDHRIFAAGRVAGISVYRSDSKAAYHRYWRQVKLGS